MTIGVVALIWLSAAPGDHLDDERSARQAFSDGERAFADDDYELALGRFRRAMELAPHDAVRFNVAVCLERLGRFRDAYLEYQAAAGSAQLDAPSRARAKEQQARVRERLSLVVVEAPVGAEVALDGVLVGMVPCEILVDPKAHVVELRRGAATVRTAFEAGRGETRRLSLAFPLESPPVPAATARRVGVGPLTWIGALGGVLGLGAFTGFGLRAKGLHDAYVQAPTALTRDEGIFMRDVANVSLAVGLLGALLAAVDLAWLAQRPAP
jgi:hypothetical protein